MVSPVPEKFTSNTLPSYYTTEPTEDIIFSPNPPSVYLVRAYTYYKRRLVPVFNQQGHQIETEKYDGIPEGLFESPTNQEIIT